MMKQWIRLIAVLMLVVFCFTACGTANTPEDPETPENETPDNGNETPDGNEEPEDEKPVLLDPSQALILAENRKTEFVIVCDDALTSTARTKINTFVNQFWNKTGATLKIKKDTDAMQAKEIVVYTMNDRREVSDLMDRVTAPEGRGYYIKMENEKIIVACEELMYLQPALDLLMSAVSDCGNGVYGVKLGYEGKLDIPAPVTSATSRILSVYTGNSNYTVSVSNATKKNYQDFCAKLDRSMELYSTNKIGDNEFATYVVDTVRGQMAAYTMYYPTDKSYRVTYGPLGYLPSLTAEDGNAVRPSITQNDRDGSEQSLGYSAPGMCHFIQLSDGRFVLFDSGPYSKNDASSKDDVDELYNLLKSMTPNKGTPVIAAWLFSHAHGDHMQLATAFLERYHGQVSLEMIGHTFPDSANLPNSGNFGGMAANITEFCDSVKKYYPKAETWVCHSGEILQLPTCKIEVIYTPEDFSSDPDLGGQADGSILFPSGNHTCTVFRATVGETKFLVMGDAEATLCEWIGVNYKTALKSDIFSVSHHGSNGGNLQMYQYVDPSIVFWPVDKARFDSSNWQTLYDYNRYLLSGKREHYTASETKTIYC